jgi:cytochrome c peroxidase
MKSLPLLFASVAAVAFASAGQLAAQVSPLGPPTAPFENPITPEKAVLGKILFWEEQISSDDSMACGTCHQPSVGFADPREQAHPGYDGLFNTADDIVTTPGVIRATSDGNFSPDPIFGLREQSTGRRTPDIFGALYSPTAFWDGRAEDAFYDPISGALLITYGGSLESQVAGPPLSTAEMAHEGRDWGMIATKIQRSLPLSLASDLPNDVARAIALYPTYPELFEEAFGTPDVTAARIIFAIATYERTLVPDDTPYFRWFMGQTNAMTPDQVIGHDQFMTIALCTTCHQPPTFTQPDFFNLGLRDWQEDPGRMDVTGQYADRGKFKSPSLLSVGLRPRFMHNGEHDSLWPGGVGQLYMDGGGPVHDNLDVLLEPLDQVPGIDMAKIMDFVGNALTDTRLRDELFPFDRPTLYSERFPAGSNEYGFATPAQPGGTVPRLLAKQPAYPGAENFRIGLDGGPANANSRLVISAAPLGGAVRGGVALFADPRQARDYFVVTSDAGGGVGYATVKLPIPNDPGLIDTYFYAQWFIDDPTTTHNMLSTGAAGFRIRN